MLDSEQLSHRSRAPRKTALNAGAWPRALLRWVGACSRLAASAPRPAARCCSGPAAPAGLASGPCPRLSHATVAVTGTLGAGAARECGTALLLGGTNPTERWLWPPSRCGERASSPNQPRGGAPCPALVSEPRVSCPGVGGHCDLTRWWSGRAGAGGFHPTWAPRCLPPLQPRPPTPHSGLDSASRGSPELGVWGPNLLGPLLPGRLRSSAGPAGPLPPAL